MISAYNYFRRLRELKNHPEEMPSIKQELYEIFHELPVGSKRLIESIVDDATVDEAETVRIKDFIYREGRPGGYEIRLLFEIHDHVYGHINDPSWEKLFLCETTKFFTESSSIKKKLPLAKAAMLYDQVKKSIQRIGMVSEVEMALLKNLIDITGDLISMKGANKQFLTALFEEILQDEKIDFKEVELLKEMIFQNKPPLEEDIDLLFDIHSAIVGKPRDELWQVLFVESVVLFMNNQPYEIDKTKMNWLGQKLQKTMERHQQLTTEEIELLGALKGQVGEFPPVLHNFWIQYYR